MKSLLAVLCFVTAIGAAVADEPFDPFDLAGIDRIEEAAVPLDLEFRDETGRVVTLRDLANGKPMLLVPVLHECPNICGVTLAGLVNAVGAQPYEPGTDFEIVAFGIDPDEGSTEAAADIERLRRAFPALASKGLHGVTGGPENVAAVTTALGYRYAYDERIGQFAHTAAVAVLTADGRLSSWLYGVAPDPADLKLALTDAGEGRLGTWRDRLLLLCYHYDPQTGRYTSLAQGLLRAGGAATVLFLGGFVAIGFCRERRRRSGP